LRESEERFRTIAESLPVQISISRISDATLRFTNEAYDKTFGFKKGELIGRKVQNLYFNPEDQQKVNAILKEQGHLDNKELKVKKADGAPFWIITSIRTITLGGEPSYINACIDITESKKAEEMLIRSRQEWIETFDLIPDLIAIIDNEHRIVKANKAMLNKINVSGNDAAGLYCYEYIHGDNKPHPSCPHALMLKDGKQYVSEIFEMRIGGDFLVSVTPIVDANGNIEGSVHVARDITERKRAEKELRESREKLDLALDNGSIGVWEWNIITNAIEWDERMEKIFGIGSGTFEGNYDAFEKFLVDEDIAHTRKAISNTLEFNVPFETIYRIQLKNGEIKYISTKALVNRDSEGKPQRMIGVCYDITEMKKGAEQSLFKLNEDLLRSNKELEQFAYVASHDLQEPLRMVSSFTQLLSKRYKDKLDEEANEFIQFAVDGAFRMQGLINDLLEYSRIETKGKKLSAVYIHDVLGQTIINLSLKIKEKNALVTCDELPTVMADGGQMIQLFQNLIGNALKFCKTTPMVHISAKEEKDHYLFSVRDNGIGIEPQYFDKIFQIFQRLHQKDEYSGTGIGLAICRRIAERHGGKIWVESEPGEGTTFKFTIRKNK
jgi:PAS domain S-box-containing protein